MQIDAGVDILAPPLKNINGSIYRQLYTALSRSGNVHRTASAVPTSKDNSYMYEDEPNTCTVNISEELSWEIAEIPSPSYFHKYLVGRQGAVKKRLENETGTEITIPKPYEKKDFITVKYKSIDAFSSLETRVISIVESARKRERPTHFLCIPIYSEKIAENLTKFKELCVNNSDITPEMIQVPTKLHLTIGALKLFSDCEIKQAKDALVEFAPKVPYILCGRPVRGTLKNFEIMNDEPQSVRVLYSELVLLDQSDRLQNLVDQCLEFFVEKGLMSYDYNREDVKLHCTIIHARWRRGDSRPFDASRFLADTWELGNFGECVIERLELNEMKTDFKLMKYVNTSSIKLV